MTVFHKLVKFFDRLEDMTREHLSRWPITYALVGGVFVVLFWRGVWNTADMLEHSGGFIGDILSAPFSLAISIIVLLLTGLFVSFFIGDRIILSGLKHEKKLVERAEAEVHEEETQLVEVFAVLRRIEKDISELKERMKR